MPSLISLRKALYGLRTLGAVPFSRTARARLRHPRLYQLLGLQAPHTFHEYHCRIAASYVRGPLGRVLVVGCNKGRECSAFVDLNASHVNGLDVIEATGTEFSHPQVSYMRSSASNIAVGDQTYDLVYSYATMEHVQDIEAAFREFARVTRPGGVIYSLAAPLWNSRFGHHKANIFGSYPWIHLRMTESEITALCEREGMTDPTGRNDMARHVRYMMNPSFFNKTPAARYTEACRSLPGVSIILNELNLESENVLDDAMFAELKQKGYTQQELLALGHTFVGRKV